MSNRLNDYCRRMAWKPRPARRIASALLLVLFAGDMGLHVAQAFLTTPEPAFTPRAVLLPEHHAGNGRGTECPVTEHGNDPFHHHHYPALIAVSSYAVPVEQTARRAAGSSEQRGEQMFFSPFGRAPPVRS